MTSSTGPPISRRRSLVVQMVKERGHVVVSELAAELGVSEMTIRRDVAQLAEDGRVVSYYGGVGPAHMDGPPGPFEKRLKADAAVKERISEHAADFVMDGSVIALDAGTTAAGLATRLAGRAGLRLVTASVPVISALAEADGIEIVALGGTLRRETQSFTGPSVVSAARDLQIETFFLGASGLSHRGAFDITDLDAVVKRELIQVSTKIVLMADASKFERRAMSRICGWDAVDVLITDDRIDSETRALLNEFDVDVVTVSSS